MSEAELDLDLAEEDGATLYNCSIVVGESTSEFESASFLMIVLFFLYLSSVISHFISRAKTGKKGQDRWWILCIPDSMITMILGMILGGFLQIKTDLTHDENGTHVLLDDALFDVELFNLVLLPIIIFTSGYTLTPKSLFFKQIGSIVLLAIAGTIISAFIIGGVLYALFRSSPNLPHLDFVEMMIFGSLIAAIDPVATLSIFMKLKVDPRLSMILFGESIINDAVSIVLYTTFTTFVGLCGNIQAVDILSAVGIFLGTFIGSLVLAIIVSMLASLSMKYIQFHSPLHQAIVLFLWSYMSFELATVCHLSGICCSLFAGIFMGYLVPKSQSDDAHKFTVSFFSVLAELAESVVFFEIGLNAVIFNVGKVDNFPWLFAVATFLLCVLARIVAVTSLAGIMNVRRKNTRFTWQHMIVLSHAGLRGAIAYALSLNFPVETDKNGRSVTDLIVNTTTFTILVSVFLLGPTTPPLLKCLRIPMGKGYVSGSSTANLRPWQQKIQKANQNKLLIWLTKDPASHSYKPERKLNDESDFLGDDLEDDTGNGANAQDMGIEMADVEDQRGQSPDHSDLSSSGSDDEHERETSAFDDEAGDEAVL